MIVRIPNSGAGNHTRVLQKTRRPYTISLELIFYLSVLG